jgi:hypothetical protein
MSSPEVIMRRSLFIAVLLAAGCAQASAPPVASPARSTTLIASDLGNIEITTYRDTRGVHHHLPASADQLWPLLSQAYSELGLEVTTINTKSRTVGNQRLMASRRLAGEQMSMLLSCGTGGVAGVPLANSGRVEMSVLSTLEPLPDDRARLVTRVQATSRPSDGTSTGPVDCASTGRLEGKIADHVRHAFVLKAATGS